MIPFRKSLCMIDVFRERGHLDEILHFHKIIFKVALSFGKVVPSNAVIWGKI